MGWEVEKKSNALKDICQLDQCQCRNHIKGAYREFMPQLNSDEMKYIANEGIISRSLLESKLKTMKMTQPQLKILREICDTCVFHNVGVSVRIESVNVSQLTVTQSEANVNTINEIASRLHPKSLKPTNMSHYLQTQIHVMTQKDPIIVSRDNKVIDGHHRFHAIKRTKPDASVCVIRLDVPHYHAMVISWAFSKNAHKF